jgi:hypothetical protein
MAFSPKSDEIRGITELVVAKPDRFPALASVSTTFVARAFTGLAPDVETLLGMRYTAKGIVAWRRDAGLGRIYAYFGPMDIKPREESWVVAYGLPFRFLKDGLHDAFGDGKLASIPASLNLGVREVYLVETADAILALNMSPSEKTVKTPAGLLVVPARGLARIGLTR